MKVWNSQSHDYIVKEEQLSILLHATCIYIIDIGIESIQMYSGYFSGGLNFAVFTVDHWLQKLNLWKLNLPTLMEMQMLTTVCTGQ